MELKKNKSIDYARKTSLFFSIGLCCSLLLVFSAFQIKATVEPEIIVFNENQVFEDPVIPPTEFEQPKPPKVPQVIKLIEVENKIDLPELEDPIIDLNNEEDLMEDFVFTKQEDEVTNDEIVIAETNASFPGGQEAWIKFLKKNLNYPKFAKRSGIEGKVLLSFVVDKEGNISDVQVLCEIGGGCDEEAKRVLEMSPKWNPGLQRGNPVKSRMSMFIHFVLK